MTDGLEDKTKELFASINLSNEAKAKINKAIDICEKAHKDQKRKSGEAFAFHPIEVAIILAKLKLDPDTIIAALLHDTVEDTTMTLEQIEKDFGKNVAALVDGVTKLSKISFRNKEENQAENFRKMIVAMAKDIRVILVKLADRLHNMRTLKFMTPVKQREIAQETLDIYAPLANRLGIFALKAELEDLCLLYLKPETYYKIEEKFAKTKKERDKYISDVIALLKENLDKHNFKYIDVQGRQKHFYSIFKKMEQRNLEFEQINDIVAFRIMVNNIQECYEVLGMLHSILKPVPGRFKDFVAIPKANMYQSLHTTLIGPHGERIEVQIRTKDMHKIAEEGIAAHWLYKEGKTVTDKSANKFKWLKQLIEWQQDLDDPTEFLQTVKVDLFAEEVYVFTPKGDVREFPIKSTPVDFAYDIHTHIGDTCVGAKMNGRIVPLNYKMKNGDIVEIITQEGHTPNKDWLKFVVTSKARAKIRQFIKAEERAQSKILGHEILEKELRKYKFSLSKLEKSGELLEIAQKLKFGNIDDLLLNISFGKLQVAEVSKKLLPENEVQKIKEAEEAILEKVKKTPDKKSHGGIYVKGIDGVLIRYAKCCTPVYGEPIVGYITRGRGITIHTTDCQRATDVDPARKVDVEWDKKEKATRNVKLRVISIDYPGILALITKTITLFCGNIIGAQCRTTKDRKGVHQFEVAVTDSESLFNMIKEIEKLKGVISVERLKS